MAFEDQTDEDFFDKLVDDEINVLGSEKMSGDLSSLSLGGGELASDAEGRKGNELAVDEVANEPELAAVGSSEESSTVHCLSEESSTAVEYSGESSTVAENSEDSSIAAIAVAKDGKISGTGVKEVQWNAFNFEGQQSEADFFVDDSGGPVSNLQESSSLYSSFIEQPGLESSTFIGSSEQKLDSRFYSSVNEQTFVGSQQLVDSQFEGSGNMQTTDNNDPQYWENLYPGWKYDYSTGQWYQVDSYDTNVNSSSANYDMGKGVHNEEVSHDSGLVASDGVVSESSSSMSYLQQTSDSILETVTEEISTSVTTQQYLQYPSNMVFDSQYPGWYYDTITQQWYTLESFTQATVNGDQNQLSQSFGVSGSFAGQDNFAYSQYNEGQAAETADSQDWDASAGNFAHRDWDASMSTNASQSYESLNNSNQIGGFNANQQSGSFYGSWDAGSYKEPILNNGHARNSALTVSQGFVPKETTYQYSQQPGVLTHSVSRSFGPQATNNYSQPTVDSVNASFSQTPFASSEGRSSAGRPPHALVSFGFGGKLIVVEDSSMKTAKMNYGSQVDVNATIAILNMMELVGDEADSSMLASHSSCSYFQSLCQQSFPGPLVGGSAVSKDVNKWIDERIRSLETYTDFHKAKLLKLLLWLLKIICQHYGKLRSSYGGDPSHEEADGPESAVAKLFASARKDGGQLGDYASLTYCLKNFPSESQVKAAAVDVHNLLISGRRKEALQRAQEGYLWGPALILAAQLGDKFYVETVKRMAHQQFISGSPLRTLCLLIAGQPADVFSADGDTNNFSTGANAYHQTSQIPSNSMLECWEENLAIITANRTKDDELVITHLGDCLWRERGEVTAAHTCYLVAEKDFESYSDSARMCLIGADHLKCPRTYASPEAIQRTEFYEYAKVLGNSQFVLLPFQPYKLIYACMLAEVGKVSDSLKYCQASLKLLRNCGRASEIETWKLYFTSLEERLRTHQQGGYSSNLAPSKFVGKLLTSIDKSIKGMIGAPPLPLPPIPNGNGVGKASYSAAPRVATSQSTMAMSSLVPSASVEAISQWAGEGNRKTMHNRSISEPDFGRSPNQAASGESGSPDSQNKESGGSLRFGRFGSQLFQKTIMGWVSRPRADRQAKLGERNKFYYDEKLKRWVEEGTQAPTEEPAVPPPPTTSSFQNGAPDYNINNAFKTQTVSSNGGLESEDHSSATPPIPPSTNQFSARARMGVRSRYVDTFNKGNDLGLTTSFQSPSIPSVKPAVPATFFVPTAPQVSDEQTNNEERDGIHNVSTNEEPSYTSTSNEYSFVSPLTSSSSMQRFPSMDNIVTPSNKKAEAITQTSRSSVSSRTRAASWGGFQFNPSEHVGNVTNEASRFIPHHDHSQLQSSSSSQQLNGSSVGEDLHEVEL